MGIELTVLFILVAITLLAACIILAIALHKLENRFEVLVDRYTLVRERVDALESHVNDLYLRINELEWDLETSVVCEDDDEDDVIEDDIYLIEPEDYLFSEYKKVPLHYNKEDDKLWITSNLTNYDTCILPHPSKIIGDGLSFFGVRSGSDEVVYVRNHKLKTDFYIRLDKPTYYGGYVTVTDNIEPIKEGEPVKENECRIKNVDGHYEVYVNGEFYCSADTISEAALELENALTKEREEA